MRVIVTASSVMLEGLLNPGAYSLLERAWTPNWIALSVPSIFMASATREFVIAATLIDCSSSATVSYICVLIALVFKSVISITPPTVRVASSSRLTSLAKPIITRSPCTSRSPVTSTVFVDAGYLTGLRGSVTSTTPNVTSPSTVASPAFRILSTVRP